MARRKATTPPRDPWDIDVDALVDGVTAGVAEPASKSTGDPTEDIRQLEAEMATMPHLTADRRLELSGLARSYADCRRIDYAAEAIERLPGPTEAWHVVVCGKFALWDLVPAAYRLAGTIDTLHIATLGFSKSNIAELCRMLDMGRIRGARLLCSHYFKGTSKPIYEYATQELTTRPAAAFLSIRTHAKILLLSMANGQTLTVEASANLRSCQNIEQLTLYGAPDLYRFHRGWIDQLFTEAATHG